MKKSILYICICFLLSPKLNAQESLFRIFINDVNTTTSEDNEEEENNENFTDWVSFFANKCAYTSTDIEDLNNRLNQGDSILCNNVYSNPSDDSELTEGLNISLSINLTENSSEIFDYFKFVNSLNINNSKSLNGFNKIQASNNILLNNNESKNISIFSDLNYVGNFNITNNKIDILNLPSINLTRIDNLVYSGNISNTVNMFNGLNSANSVTIVDNKAEELIFANNIDFGSLKNFTFNNNEIKTFTGIPKGYIDSVIISNNSNLKNINAFSNVYIDKKLELRNNPNLDFIQVNTTGRPLDDSRRGNIVFDNLGFNNLDLNNMYPNALSVPAFEIINNSKLRIINGLGVVYNGTNETNFDGNIVIENNQILEKISGFNGKLYDSDFSIRNNNILNEIQNFNVSVSDSNIFIENNPLLEIIDSGFSRLNEGKIIIKNNNNLKIFKNWSNLEVVQELDFFIDAPNLELLHIEGKNDCAISKNNNVNISPNVTESEGFNIKTYEKLKNIKLFSNCAYISSDINIFNTYLDTIDFGIEAIRYNNIKIENNKNIRNLDLLKKEKDFKVYGDPNTYKNRNVIISLKIINNENLLSINGLKNTGGHPDFVSIIEIRENKNLNNISIFDNNIDDFYYRYVPQIEQLIIENNNYLSNMSTFDLDYVDSISIKNNNFNNVNMLSKLNNVGKITIVGHINMNDLSGLNNISSISKLSIEEKNYNQKINNPEICGCLYTAGNIFKEDGTFYSNRQDYCVIPENLDNTSCSSRSIF